MLKPETNIYRGYKVLCTPHKDGKTCLLAVYKDVQKVWQKDEARCIEEAYDYIDHLKRSQR